MNTDSNINEETQPIKVNTAKDPSEDTTRVKIVQQKQPSAETIPGWLLEFAAQPTQEASVESQHGLEAIEELSLEPVESIAPIVLETAEWHEVQAELEYSAPVSVEEGLDPLAEQNVENLLVLGEYDAAVAQIRKSATTKELAEEYQQMLRSHLVLQGDRLPLWNVYDELSEMIAQKENQVDGG